MIIIYSQQQGGRIDIGASERGKINFCFSETSLLLSDVARMEFTEYGKMAHYGDSSKFKAINLKAGQPFDRESVKGVSVKGVSTLLLMDNW